MNGSRDDRLGACPGAAALASFAEGTLPPDEAECIQAHVSGCGVCDSLVESLRKFDDPITDATPGWAGTERRLRAKVFPRARWWWILHPAVAYGIAFAAVIVAVMPVRRPASPAMITPSLIELQSVRTIDLNATRGAVVPRVTPGVGDRFVLLSFLIDIRRGYRYIAALDGRKAGEVSSSDGKGNFAVVVSRDLLNSGAHRLVVTEIDQESGKAGRSIDFPFQI